MRMIFFIASAMIAGMWSVVAYGEDAPWGISVAQVAGYAPQKVVYDVAVSTPDELAMIFDRIGALNFEYGTNPFHAAIIIVLNGPEIQFFDTNDFKQHEDLMRRAQSLTTGGVVEFRMCQRTAGNMGIQPADVHGFIEMVPMADAEIIRLQQEENFAYIKP